MADIESMQTATTAVFDTPELLEMILLKLPMADILHLQRTCPTRHAAVKTSIRLQRRLYFAAVPVGDWDKYNAGDYNPLLMAEHSMWSDTGNSPWHMLQLRSYGGVRPGGSPRIMIDFEVNEAYCSRSKAIVPLYCETTKDASWRQMLLTQRKWPIEVRLCAAHVRIEFEGLPISRLLAEGTLASGSTMGDVYDWLEHAYMRKVGAEEQRGKSAGA
ncbi:hypothetical protein LTR36_004988 [Oleoguttula mirabilis]|uniref:F-box domain-containing protein n=1 Tax=Oleoguttula mirabilis TaxID=1507867 RepID=A0AAV9JVC5_9PEZI|nr:hypothetical protein LTR36_004988 [Oleoguttula mirabilis]